jgi:hypothetical protein
VLAFAAATFYVPARISLGYLTHILPRIGGGSGLRENVSALGNMSRLAYWLTGQPAPQILPMGARELIRNSQPSPAVLLTLAFYLALCIPAVVLSLRALHRTATGTPERNDLLRLGLSTSLFVMLMPTAWSTYQTLLLVPLAVGIALAPPPGRAKLTWGLLLLAGAAGAINMGSTYAMAVVVLRSLIPLALWLAYLLLLDAKSQGPSRSGAEVTGGA